MDETNKYIIQSIYDSQGMKKFQQDLKSAETESRKYSAVLSKEAKFVNATWSESMTKTGQQIITTTGYFEDQGRKVAVSTKRIGDNVGLLKDKVNATHKSLKDSIPFANDFIRAFSRVLIVVPVWALFRSILMGVAQTFQSSVKFLVDWEYQLAQMRIVGAGTEQQLQNLSRSLLSLSTTLGVSNEKLGEGAKLWIQQGRAISEIIPLMDATAKLSLLTGRTITQSVEDLTAVLSAYKLEAKDAINVINTVSNVELQNAITADDLVSAYRQVASTASTLGVSFQTLTGYITAIKEATRDTGNRIGLSLRTMFTRISTSSAKSIQTLSGVPLFLDKMGNVTKRITPNMRNLEDIIFELSLSFQNMTEAQKAQLAQLIGGTQRINQVMALFNTFDKSITATADAMFGFGKANKNIGILLDTTKIKTEQLVGAWGELINAIGGTDAFKGTLDALKNIVRYVTFLSNSPKFLNIETVKRFNEDLQSTSEQLNFVKNVMLVINKIKSLDAILVRNPDKIEQITNAITVLVTKLAQASKEAGIKIEIPTNLKDPKAIIKELEKQIPELEKRAIQLEIKANTLPLKQQIASLGLALNQAIKFDPTSATSEFNRALYIMILKGGKQFEELAKKARGALARIQLGDIDVGDLQTLRRVFAELKGQHEFERLGKDAQKVFDLLKEVERQMNMIQDVTTGAKSKFSEVKTEIQKINSALQEAEFKANFKQKQAELKALGASELQLAILELAYLEKINSTEQEIVEQKQKIQELQAQTTASIVNEVLAVEKELLSIRGYNEVAILQATNEIQKQLGIEKQGLDALKDKFDLVKAIANQEKISSEDKLNALQKEIIEEKKRQNPRVQQALKDREKRLTAEAQKLGIDVNKFLPQLPATKDILSFKELGFNLPPAIKEAIAGKGPLDIRAFSSAMETLVSNLTDKERSLVQQSLSIGQVAINIQLTNQSKEQLVNAIVKELRKPNSKLDQALNQTIEEF